MNEPILFDATEEMRKEVSSGGNDEETAVVGSNEISELCKNMKGRKQNNDKVGFCGAFFRKRLA